MMMSENNSKRPSCACGWVNPWVDSGDRGYAAADHSRECEVAE
jgi:hypothetical protein